jgi:hypothetical protein
MCQLLVKTIHQPAKRVLTQHETHMIEKFNRHTPNIVINYFADITFLRFNELRIHSDRTYPPKNQFKGSACITVLLS